MHGTLNTHVSDPIFSGSPFSTTVYDWNNIAIAWESAKLVPVSKPVTLTLDPRDSPNAQIEAHVIGKDLYLVYIRRYICKIEKSF